jgi:hypothetical protein
VRTIVTALPATPSSQDTACAERTKSTMAVSLGSAAVGSIIIMRLTQASKQVSRGEATGKLLPSCLKKHDGRHPGHWESSAGKGAASMDQCRVSML